MALARYGREKEHTIGEGDCAFNAFTLALCNPVVISQIERSCKAARQDISSKLESFIMQAAVELGTEVTWEAVKQKLIYLREHDKEKLQRTIAPIMRQLSYDIAVNSPDAILLKAKTVDKLVSVFNDYSRKKRNKSVTSHDDIFSRHTFITDKFYEVYNGKDKDKLTQRKNIENWWWNEGYDLFLAAMSQPQVWAGDIELARLAKYFNVVLNIVPEEGFLYNIHGDYGYFPFLDNEIGKDIPKDDRGEVMDLLRNRFVLAQGYEDVHEHGVNFAMSNFADISRRLSAVPNYNTVFNFIDSQPALKGEMVPANWPKRCLDELIQRNVIGRASGCARNEIRYTFSKDKNDAMALIAEIPHADKVLRICRAHYKTHPTLVLHKSPDHWSNTRNPEEERQAAAQENMMRVMEQSIFAPNKGLVHGSAASFALRTSPGGMVQKKT